MEISRRTDYGIRVILDLASLPEGKRASTQEIASRQEIPSPFLAKIISQLSLSGLVSTYRGQSAGRAGVHATGDDVCPDGRSGGR